MITISLCMIVKNEEDVLGRCLSSIKDAVDEIIIVDTGSTDKTKEIALKYTDKIYDFKWCDDFAKARNKSFEYATKEYILWLDADDVISPENLIKLKTLKSTLTKTTDTVTMVYSLTRDENDKTVYSLRRNRLVKRENKFKWIGQIHEYINTYGNSFTSDIEVWHKKDDHKYTDRNLRIFRSMEKNKVNFTPRDMFYFANELYYNGLYEESINQYRLFLDTKQGWIEDVKTAFLNLSKCYKNLNDSDNAKKVLLESLSYDIPRADICCGIGESFFNEKNYLSSIFWYQAALNCKPSNDNLGINCSEFYTYIPAIQLCVCYCAIEDYTTGFYFNELASIYTSDQSKIIHNRNFITGKLKEKNLPIPNIEKSIKIKDLI